MNGSMLALGTVGLLAAGTALRAARGSPDREDAVRALSTNANLDAICTYAAIFARPPSKLLHRAAATKERVRWISRLHAANTASDEASVLFDALREDGVGDDVLLVVGDVDMESGIADAVQHALGGNGWPTSWLDDAIESADAAIQAQRLRRTGRHPADLRPSDAVQETLTLRTALARALETGDDAGLADAAVLAHRSGFVMDSPALAATHAAVLLHLSSDTHTAWYYAVRAAIPTYARNRPQHEWIRAWRRLALRVLMVRPDLAPEVKRYMDGYRAESERRAWAHGPG